MAASSLRNASCRRSSAADCTSTALSLALAYGNRATRARSARVALGPARLPARHSSTPPPFDLKRAVHHLGSSARIRVATIPALAVIASPSLMRTRTVPASNLPCARISSVFSIPRGIIAPSTCRADDTAPPSAPGCPRCARAAMAAPAVCAALIASAPSTSTAIRRMAATPLVSASDNTASTRTGKIPISTTAAPYVTCCLATRVRISVASSCSANSPGSRYLHTTTSPPYVTSAFAQLGSSAMLRTASRMAHSSWRSAERSSPIT
mmetsp:Transcript_16432/g.46324  ORF Transcript_16432/g.46324 Transcript_16432/m.46324 type:complete len:267 (+) Transcript_16432:166-966(+)